MGCVFFFSNPRLYHQRWQWREPGKRTETPGSRAWSGEGRRKGRGGCQHEGESGWKYKREENGKKDLGGELGDKREGENDNERESGREKGERRERARKREETKKINLLFKIDWS